MAREAIRLRGTGGQGDELVLTTNEGTDKETLDGRNQQSL